ncbi:MAG: hypothetical protein JXQ74_01465 [Alphaproteobacteria bacterium]|nr:hypothetical protein [Alphaproteobacteria bacterium]
MKIDKENKKIILELAQDDVFHVRQRVISQTNKSFPKYTLYYENGEQVNKKDQMHQSDDSNY